MRQLPAVDILFTPLTIRNVTLRNRFVMPGMQRGFMDDGAPAPKMIEYMRRCAAGGAGRFRDIDLFSRKVHLAEVFENLEPGFQEEGRRNVAAD